MKIKIQPAGKAVIAVIFLLLLYILLKATGVLDKLPSLSTKFDDKTQTNTISDQKKLDREINIGFSNYNFSPAIFFANGGLIAGENSLFRKKFDLPVKILEYKDDDKAIDAFLKGGENSGIDVMILRLDQFLLNYNRINPINPSVFLLTEKKDNRNFIIARSYIKTPRLLLGRKIAVQKNSSSYFYLLDFLGKNAITKNDVNIIFTEDDKEAVAKTKSRFANVCILSDINLYREFRKEKDYIDLTPRTVTNNPQIAIAQRSFISEHYAAFCRLLEGYFFTIDSMAKEPTRLNETLMAYYKTGEQIEPGILAKYTAAFYMDNYRFFDIDNNGNDEGLAKMIDKVKMVLNKSEMFKLFIDPKGIQYPDILKELSAKYKIDYSSKEPQIITKPQTQAEIKKSGDISIALKTDTIKKKLITAAPVTAAPVESAGKNRFSLFFAPNDSKMDSVSKSGLSSFLRNLSEYNKYDFDIRGNTDSTGEDKYNFMLSKWRAEAVAEFLKTNFNISAEKMKVFGQGSRYPFGSNKEERGKRRNRRVDIIIKTK